MRSAENLAAAVSVTGSRSAANEYVAERTASVADTRSLPSWRPDRRGRWNDRSGVRQVGRPPHRDEVSMGVMLAASCRPRSIRRLRSGSNSSLTGCFAAVRRASTPAVST